MFFLVTALILTNVYLIPYYFTSQFEYLIIECLIPFLNNIYINKNQKRIIEVKIFNETKNEPLKINILHCEELNHTGEINESYLSYDELIASNDNNIVDQNTNNNIFNQNTDPIIFNQNTDPIIVDQNTDPIIVDQNTDHNTNDTNSTESSGELVEKVNELNDDTDDKLNDDTDDKLNDDTDDKLNDDTDDKLNYDTDDKLNDDKLNDDTEDELDDDTEDELDDEYDRIFSKNIIGVFRETITNFITNNSNSTDYNEVTSESIFVEMVE